MLFRSLPRSRGPPWECRHCSRFVVRIHSHGYHAAEPLRLSRASSRVFPAKAGIQGLYARPQRTYWIPAFAGKTRGDAGTSRTSLECCGRCWNDAGVVVFGVGGEWFPAWFSRTGARRTKKSEGGTGLSSFQLPPSLFQLCSSSFTHTLMVQTAGSP